jgi:hypothetical protein
MGGNMKSLWKPLALRFGLALVTSTIIATAASADANWAFVGDGLDAIITVSGTANSAGSYDVLGISGSIAGYGSIDSLVANPNQPGAFTFTGNPGGTYFTFDNDFFNTGQHFDGDGIVFKLTDGLYATLWGNSPSNYELFIGDWLYDQSGTPEVFEQVPEPSSLSVLLAAFLVLGGFMASRRAKRTMVPQAA